MAEHSVLCERSKTKIVSSPRFEGGMKFQKKKWVSGGNDFLKNKRGDQKGR